MKSLNRGLLQQSLYFASATVSSFRDEATDEE